MRSVIITGPTGVLGMALIEKCIQENIEVLAISHKNSARNCKIKKNSLVTIYEADLSELRTLKYNKKYDCFYHLAWQGTYGEDRNDLYKQLLNIQYTLDAVELANQLGCHTFIGAGSQAEYGRTEGVLNPETKTSPENAYGAAKLCAGQMSRILCEERGIRHVWTRILSVYGSYDGGNTMIMSSLKKMLNGEPTEFTKGEQYWDYLYSDDAATALYLLGLYGENNKVYCIGSGKAMQLREYINIMRCVTNSVAELGIGKLSYSEKQVMFLQADIEDLIKDTGFSTKTDFKEGIEKTIQYIKKNEV